MFIDLGEEEMTLEFSMPWFSFRNITFQCVFADPFLLLGLVLLEMKQFLGSVLIFEQRTKQKQLNAQIDNGILCDLALISCL